MRPRHPAAAWIGLWLTGLALLGLPGCGGGTDPLPAPDTLSRSSAEPAGAHSAHGGTRFEAGLDLDRDQVLDDDEVTRTDYVCRPAGVAWVEVSEASVQAVANTGYRTAGSADITLTLPATDTLAVGDLVSVAGGGTGAWTLAQNAGQTVYGGSLGHLAVSWTPREENRGWQAVASSADGQRLAAVEYGGRIYTSTDAGETWTARDSDRLWYTIASSADGLHLVAGVPGGQLYTSADGGLNWTARESNRLWFSVAMSADGERMVAAEYGGQVYTSTDRGVNWTPRETNRAWASLTASSDGLRLVGLVFGGQIHTSGDGGITWSARASVGNWISVAGAADGQTLVAAQSGGQLHASTDGGATWVPRATDHNWSNVCSSADGRQMLAVEHGGQIHKSTPFSTRGVTGGVRGGRYDALELQYLGDGVFMPLSHEGTLSVF